MRNLLCGIALAVLSQYAAAADREQEPTASARVGQPESAVSTAQTTRTDPNEEKGTQPKHEEEEVAINTLYSETVQSQGYRRGRWTDNSIVCKRVTRTGSRLKEERCMSAAQWEFLRKETEEELRSGALR